MGLFDWTIKYKFDSEKQTLIDLRTHSIDWYNQLTEPLIPLLTDIKFDTDSIDAEKYTEIAKQIFKMKVISGAGGRLENVLRSMSNRGIPAVTDRKRMVELANDYQNRGLFIKELILGLQHWDKYPARRDNFKQHFLESWESFETAKDMLVAEINRQLKRLG